MDQATLLRKLSGEERLIQTLQLSNFILRISLREKRRLERQKNPRKKFIESKLLLRNDHS